MERVHPAGQGQEHNLEQQHLEQPVKGADRQNQPLQKEVWHRKTSVMEIFRSSLGSDDEIIEDEEPLQDHTSSASVSPRSRFPQTKSQSRSNVWGPVYLNRENFIDMHIR